MSFFLFPGQGSQTPGMGRDFYEAGGEARAVFDAAAAISPAGWLESIFEGTPEQLAQTRLAQPALLTVGVAITRSLATRGIEPSGCAGHSLGEFTALVAAGALEFEEALRLVQVRARLMSEDIPEGGMAAVIGLDAQSIEDALPEGAGVANFNGPQQTIISGTTQAIAESEGILKAAGARRVMPLKVSGPFHSELMRPAADAFRDALAEQTFNAPAAPFISSVAGAAVSDPAEIQERLAQQICGPVRWTAVMETIGAAPALEVGPGRVLQGLAKRMDGGPEVRLAGTLNDLACISDK